MKPYYVLACVGAVDEAGAPEKFGVLGADSPAEAEGLVRKLAGMHRQQGESVELCVLQAYRVYPANLMTEILEAQAKEKSLRETAQYRLDERNQMAKQMQALREENARLRSEQQQTPTKRKAPTKRKKTAAKKRKTA